MESSPNQTDWRDQIPELLPAALRLAIRLCGGETLAEDAVQNAMLKLIRGLGQFEGRSKLSTYFTRIVIHECRDLLSRNRREIATEVLDATNPATNPATDSTCNPAGLLEQSEAVEKIRQAVMSLPDRQREIMVLSVWDQRSNAEIAELLNIDIQNIYANLSLARKHLKQRLHILNQKH